MAVAAPEPSALGRRLPLLLAALAFAGAGAGAQQAPQAPREAAGDGDGLAVTFLFNYYDQDGDRSPVTGGIGTEDLQVAAPHRADQLAGQRELAAQLRGRRRQHHLGVDQQHGRRRASEPVLRRAHDHDHDDDDDEDEYDDEYDELDGTSSASPGRCPRLPERDGHAVLRAFLGFALWRLLGRVGLPLRGVRRRLDLWTWRRVCAASPSA